MPVQIRSKMRRNGLAAASKFAVNILSWTYCWNAILQKRCLMISGERSVAGIPQGFATFVSKMRARRCTWIFVLCVARFYGPASSPC